jgi:enoyl-[acyl-carrier protein] reductase III
MTHELDLSGKHVFLTGGSGAIGRALAVAFASRGAKVAFTFFMGHDGRAVTEEAIAAAGGPLPLAIQCNLREKGGAEEAAAVALEAFGHIDILIHNAATGVLKPATEISAKSWTGVMEVNARALLGLVQVLTPGMPSGGRVIALSSAGADRALEFYAAIGASKAALESLVRHLATELGPRGITANVLRPGVVDTPALEHFPNRERMLEVANLRTPNGRIATPEDVANVALLLASPLAAMIQGQTITVDGGYSILA